MMVPSDDAPAVSSTGLLADSCDHMASYISVAGKCLTCGKQITKQNHMTPTQLLGQLIENGGAIVTSQECSIMEIANAQAGGRFAVDAECYGYVRRTKEWLAIQKNREAAHPNTDGIYSANKHITKTPEI